MRDSTRFKVDRRQFWDSQTLTKSQHPQKVPAFGRVSASVARVANFWLPSRYPTLLAETLIRIKIEPDKIRHYFFFPVKAEIANFLKILV